MGSSQVGSCPKCGAPIWIPLMWHGIIPPTPQFSCNCFPQQHGIATTDGTSVNFLPQKPVPRLANPIQIDINEMTLTEAIAFIKGAYAQKSNRNDDDK
jgi:hypothetical protein